MVLGLVSMVGALALVSLLFHNPTGAVAQDTSVYPLDYGQSLPMPCAQGPAYLLGNNGMYAVYCCSEDMIGQNTCRRPQTIKLA